MTAEPAVVPRETGATAIPPVAEPRGDGAAVIYAAPLAAGILDAVRRDVQSFRDSHGFTPTLAAVIVGRDPPSLLYVQRIRRTCEEVGVPGRVIELPENATPGQLRSRIEDLNGDPLVAGIIVQQPLPPGIPLRTVIDAISPAKDVDGIHPLNAGLMTLGYEGFFPACAEAAVQMLRRSGYELAGRRAVVIGRSNVVGKPVELLLLREHCTVTVCHRRTRDLAGEVGRADVVVCAAGAAGLVTGSMLKPGALVVDVGINVVDGRVTGDVDFESARRVAAAITPVPGGVGRLTNAVLVEHLARAARWQYEGGSLPLRSASPRPPRAATAG